MHILLLAVMIACDGDGPDVPTVTIPATDSTSPTVRLDIVQGNDSIFVESGGAEATLQSQVGSDLVLLVTAHDPESGARALSVFETVTRTFCDESLCRQEGSGLAGSPTFSDTQPARQPGDEVAARFAKTYDFDVSQLRLGPAQPDPGDSWTITLTLWASATNYLGGESKSPVANIVWTRP